MGVKSFGVVKLKSKIATRDAEGTELLFLCVLCDSVANIYFKNQTILQSRKLLVARAIINNIIY